MPGQLFDPEMAASIPEIVSYSVAGAGVALGGIAFALSRKIERLKERYRQRDMIEPKTGLLNAKAFESEFKLRTGQTKRAADQGRIHGIIFGDIDDFKALNTDLTHPVTDKVALLPVAEILKQSVRPDSDVVSRFGGEEFALLLCDTDLEGTLSVGRNVQGQVNAIHPDSNQPDRHLGMTLAYTTFPQGMALDGLLEKLSARVTEAKQVPGKNQLVGLEQVPV